MANTTSIRSFLEDTQAGLELLLSLTDEQLESREKLADMKNMLLIEREAADRLVTELPESGAPVIPAKRSSRWTP